MTSLLILGVVFCAGIATLLGGVFALSLHGRHGLVLGFSAGAVLGVAFFDLLPEALSLGGNIMLATVAAGFFLYLLFDRLVMRHGKPARGLLGAASLSAHSLLDGFGIGIAFQAGHGAGLVVSAAVLAHDFADGLNTVNVVTKNGGSRAQALRWLTVDAAAPLLGAGLSLFFSLSAELLGLLLAGFAGFFFYIGAVDLLPESVRAAGRLPAAASVVAGALFLYGVARLAM